LQSSASRGQSRFHCLVSDFCTFALKLLAGVVTHESNTTIS